MQVMDIVNRAAFDSGVSPSFNPDEVPEDIQERGADILRNELIRDINCDQTLSLCETVVKLSPRRGVLDLRSTPLDYDHFIYQTAPYNGDFYMQTEYAPMYPQSPSVYYMRNLIDYLVDLGVVKLEGTSNPYAVVTRTEKWATNQLGEPMPIAFWSIDGKLIEVPTDISALFNVQKPDFISKRFNVPFDPTQIEEIYRASDGAPLDYVHAGELVSCEFRHSPLVYTVEEFEDRLRVRFTQNFGDVEVLLILPVPIKVINSFDEPHPYQGRIIAPPKFRSYLINALAWRLAGSYGIATEANLEKKASVSYNALIKNRVKREHPQDVDRRIAQYIHRGRGWAVGTGDSAYGGGFYG